MPLVLTRNPALLSLLTGFGAFLEAVASATHSVRVVAYIGVGLVMGFKLSGYFILLAVDWVFLNGLNRHYYRLIHFVGNNCSV